MEKLTALAPSLSALSRPTARNFRVFAYFRMLATAASSFSVRVTNRGDVV